MKRQIILPKGTTQGLLAVSVVWTVCALSLMAKAVPDVLGDLALAAVMYFLGQNKKSES